MDWFRGQDQYGKGITLNFQNAGKFKTVPGGVLSVIFRILIWCFIFLKWQDMTNKKDWRGASRSKTFYLVMNFLGTLTNSANPCIKIYRSPFRLCRGDLSKLSLPWQMHFWPAEIETQMEAHQTAEEGKEVRRIQLVLLLQVEEARWADRQRMVHPVEEGDCKMSQIRETLIWRSISRT